MTGQCVFLEHTEDAVNANGAERGRGVRSVDVVVLSRYPDIFQGFKESIDQDAPYCPKLVVWDCYPRGQVLDLREPWGECQVLIPFRIAFNANFGWQQTPSDILYCGDDVRFIEPDTVKRLQEVAYSHYSIGLVGPLHGWHTWDGPELFLRDHFIPFVCVYIKRSLIDHIGYLDESFTGYGCEDLDFCIRARKAGAKIGWAPQIHVQHGEGKFDYGSTFKREFTESEMQAQDEVNRLKLCAKHDLPTGKQEMWDAIKNL